MFPSICCCRVATPPNPHQALQSELAKYKDDLSALEEEAADMREKLKKVAKQEKHEKGHNAMTEELKKMEEETGISVSTRSARSQHTIRDPPPSLPPPLPLLLFCFLVLD